MGGTGPGGCNMSDVIIIGGGAKDRGYHFQFLDARNGSCRLMAYFLSENRWANLPDLPHGIRKPLMTITEEGKLLVLDSTPNDLYGRPIQILRYCPRGSTWETIQVILPVHEYDFVFHSVHWSNGRLFLVASSKTDGSTARRYPPFRNQNGQQGQTQQQTSHPRYHIQLLELDLISNQLHVTFGFCQRTCGSKIHVVCKQTRDSTTIDGGVIYVMVSKCFSYKYKGRNSKYQGIKLFYYDLRTDGGREVHQCKIPWEPMAFGLPEGFICTRLGKASKKMFLHKDKKVIDTNCTISFPPRSPGREEFSYISVDDEVFIFGGKDQYLVEDTAKCTTSEALTSASKFSFTTEKWTELEPLPVAMFGAGIARGRMPVDVLRCHVECPHCYFHPNANRASYEKCTTLDRSVSDLDDFDPSRSDMSDDEYWGNDWSYDSDDGMAGIFAVEEWDLI